MDYNNHYNSQSTWAQKNPNTTPYPSDRINAPLPAGPLDSKSSTSNVDYNDSPFKTPFDDSRNTSRQSLNSPYQTRSHQPFYNDNDNHNSNHTFGQQDIPLQDTSYSNGKAGSQQNPKPMGSDPYDDYSNESPRPPPHPAKEHTGFGTWRGKPIPFAVYTLTLVQIIVFIVEIVRNSQLTGSPIATKPSFNPMIGPSPWVLINMGARYVTCMREYPATQGLTVASPQIANFCPNNTGTVPTCTLADLCGHGINLTPVNGVQPQPNQWWRFITPIFMHAGLIHIALNLFLQLTLGKDIERLIGTLRFVLVYFAAGIFGFVFGGNFAPNGVASTGCSGALAALIALTLLDLLYTWKKRRSPGTDLAWIMADIVVAFILGLLPAVDNFSHIGGFLVGLVLGICILRSPDALRERIGSDDPAYAPPMSGTDNGSGGFSGLIKNPIAFFKGRKPMWWAWWIVRAVALIAILVAFIVLTKSFYSGKNTCTWCKYLSCLPIKDWCNIGNLQFTSN